ncbi:MAG: M23 family metallopeptidase [Polyangiaceae bacterium]|nr:M23 family metallopeptidase [Polyangiaceae bacterium]
MRRAIWLLGAIGLVGCNLDEVAEKMDEKAPPAPRKEVPTEGRGEPTDAAKAEQAKQAERAERAEEARRTPPPQPTQEPRAQATVAPAPTAEQTATSGPPRNAAPSPKAAPAERLSLKGHPIQGGLVFARVDGEVAGINFPGHKVVVDDQGRFLLGFARTAAPTEKMTIRLKDGTVIDHTFHVGQRTFTPEAVEVPDDEATAEGEEAKTKAQADARIHAARMKHSKDDCWQKGFEWPAHGRVTSRYGFPRTVNDKEAGVHWGIDIAVPVGTPVKAPACGEIVFAEENVPLSGTTVVVDHGGGLTSTFLHLSAITKKVGDRIEKGEVFAKSGKTGRATGPHLDWRMNVFDVRVDPELLLPPKPAKPGV